VAAQYSAEARPTGIGTESFNPVLDPDDDPNHPQNLITSKLKEVYPSLQNFIKSAACIFVQPNPAGKQTDK